MLIEFSVTNWHSFKGQQKLSLVASRGKEMLNSNTFDPQVPATQPLLRSAAIYGPNASGKSNLVFALAFMCYMVKESAARMQPGEAIDLEPFLLDDETANAASEFEIDFIVDHVRYQYGFAANKQRITEEWLFAYPSGRPQRWLGRVWNGSSYHWETASALSGAKQLWQNSTRENALFLSTAVQLNSQQLKPVYEWFGQGIQVSDVNGWNSDYSAALCIDETGRKRILEFLKAADLAIHDIEVEAQPFDARYLRPGLSAPLKDGLLAELKDKTVYEIKTIHRSRQGQLLRFDFQKESHGTRKLFAYAGPWLNVLEYGGTMVMDEMHDNLHPALVRFLVLLFHNPQTNPHNAQLIFTTHETSILNQDIFRRDQIWFCEKGDDQASQLFPLLDFSPRKGREDLEANYLAGRYGALPYVRELKTRLE